MDISFINFTCPECGDQVLCMSQKVTEYVSMNGIDLEYLSLEPGEVLETFVDEEGNYQCNGCGFVIGHTEKEAAEWLINQGMVDDGCV